MKNPGYVELVCRGFCRFYKEGKEEMTCGAYNFLVAKFSAADLLAALEGIGQAPDFSCDGVLKEKVCSSCEFLIDGCDFREGLDSPPCGGYAAIEGLLKRGRLSF